MSEKKWEIAKKRPSGSSENGKNNIFISCYIVSSKSPPKPMLTFWWMKVLNDSGVFKVFGAFNFVCLLARLLVCCLPIGLLVCCLVLFVRGRSVLRARGAASSLSPTSLSGWLPLPLSLHKRNKDPGLRWVNEKELKLNQTIQGWVGQRWNQTKPN